MERSIEILQILRGGMESLMRGADSSSVRYTRIFNFEERRVSLRMELSKDGQEFVPMGRIDVLEIPTNNGRVTCSCTLTELQSGQSQRVVLRLKNREEKEKECEKVFGFFRNVLNLAVPMEGSPVKSEFETVKDNPEGFPTSSRGAHKQPPKE